MTFFAKGAERRVFSLPPRNARGGGGENILFVACFFISSPSQCEGERVGRFQPPPYPPPWEGGGGCLFFLFPCRLFLPSYFGSSLPLGKGEVAVSSPCRLFFSPLFRFIRSPPSQREGGKELRDTNPHPTLPLFKGRWCLFFLFPRRFFLPSYFGSSLTLGKGKVAVSSPCRLFLSSLFRFIRYPPPRTARGRGRGGGEAGETVRKKR